MVASSPAGAANDPLAPAVNTKVPLVPATLSTITEPLGSISMLAKVESNW